MPKSDQLHAFIVVKLQAHDLNPALSQAQKRYRIVVTSSLAADKVMEAYKAQAGGKVFVFEHSLVKSEFGQVAKDCVCCPTNMVRCTHSHRGLADLKGCEHCYVDYRTDATLS